MKKVIFVLGGGIGNIVQATPAIKCAYQAGYIVDLKLHCNSSNDLLEIFNIPAVRNIYLKNEPNDEYEYQLRGPFTPRKIYKAKHNFNTKVRYAQHIPEAEVYYDLVKQMGINLPMKNAEVNVGNFGPEPPHPETVAIYPGSKSNWAMKRWDKYDELAKHFKHVTLVGSRSDIYSHGSPTWITKQWNWPEHVDVFMGSLRECAYYISKCKMFIGNDGGLAHVAAGTGINTFVLFGPSCDIKNKPFADNAHVIAIDLPCRPCQFEKGPNGETVFDGNKSNCWNNMKCMKEMSVEYVLNKIKEIK